MVRTAPFQDFLDELGDLGAGLVQHPAALGRNRVILAHFAANDPRLDGEIAVGREAMQEG
jgi:hypothetical protein